MKPYFTSTVSRSRWPPFLQWRVPPALPLTHALNAHFPPTDSFHAHSPFVRAETPYAIVKAGIRALPTVTPLCQRQSVWQVSTLLVCTRGCDAYTSCFSG